MCNQRALFVLAVDAGATISIGISTTFSHMKAVRRIDATFCIQLLMMVAIITVESLEVCNFNNKKKNILVRSCLPCMLHIKKRKGSNTKWNNLDWTKRQRIPRIHTLRKNNMNTHKNDGWTLHLGCGLFLWTRDYFIQAMKSDTFYVMSFTKVRPNRVALRVKGTDMKSVRTFFEPHAHKNLSFFTVCGSWRIAQNVLR